jgi:hypothetical protein
VSTSAITDIQPGRSSDDHVPDSDSIIGHLMTGSDRLPTA